MPTLPVPAPRMPTFVKNLTDNPSGRIKPARETAWQPKSPEVPAWRNRIGSVLILTDPADMAEEYHFYLTRTAWVLHKMANQVTGSHTEFCSGGLFDFQDDRWCADPVTDAALGEIFAGYLTAIDEQELLFAELAAQPTAIHSEAGSIVDRSGGQWKGPCLVLQTSHGEAVFIYALAGNWMLVSLDGREVHRPALDTPSSFRHPVVRDGRTCETLFALLASALGGTGH